MMTHGIAISGIGAVSGYGWGTQSLWDGLCSGKPAARLMGGYGEDGQESAWLALVPEGGDPADGEGLFGRAFLAAGREAINDARARGWAPAGPVGMVHVGWFNDMYGWREISSGRSRRSRDFVRVMPSTPAAMLMKEFGLHGPSLMVSASCSSANNALLVAKQWVDSGKVEDVVVVAADLSFTPEVVAGFTRMGAAAVDVEPLEACRPFQDGGKGFPPGEAAVGLVLSSRPVGGYAHLLGGAMTSDGYHATSMDPRHTEVIRCVAEALADAGVEPGDVAYFNAHGTGTVQCNAAETDILDRLFPGAGPKIYALKPLVGHCIASAGAVELAAGLLAYQHKVVPAARIVATAHPQLLNGLSDFDGGITLKTSMGMGGHNSAVVVGKPTAT